MRSVLGQLFLDESLRLVAVLAPELGGVPDLGTRRSSLMRSLIGVCTSQAVLGNGPPGGIRSSACA